MNDIFWSRCRDSPFFRLKTLIGLGFVDFISWLCGQFSLSAGHAKAGVEIELPLSVYIASFATRELDLIEPARRRSPMPVSAATLPIVQNNPGGTGLKTKKSKRRFTLQ
jgi:hypothetical protein